MEKYLRDAEGAKYSPLDINSNRDVTDLIRQMSQLLRVELKELVDVARAMMEPIELCDKE